jgi:hypothetical protein
MSKSIAYTAMGNKPVDFVLKIWYNWYYKVRYSLLEGRLDASRTHTPATS